MTAILGSDVFPGLDTKDPLNTSDVDDVPEKFGKGWFDYQRKMGGTK